MAFKLVIADVKTKKSYKVELENTALLVGKKIGDKLPGESLKLEGYELEVTGGSDKIGTPMRGDLPGTATRKLLLTNGIGFRAKRGGLRMKKRIRGNTISEDIVQINLKVVNYGKKSLEELLSSKDLDKEEQKEEQPSEESKEEKTRDTKEEKTEEKPAEPEEKVKEPAKEKKEEPKEEKSGKKEQPEEKVEQLPEETEEKKE